MGASHPQRWVSRSLRQNRAHTRRSLPSPGATAALSVPSSPHDVRSARAEPGSRNHEITARESDSSRGAGRGEHSGNTTHRKTQTSRAARLPTAVFQLVPALARFAGGVGRIQERRTRFPKQGRSSGRQFVHSGPRAVGFQAPARPPPAENSVCSAPGSELAQRNS